jgi:integrase
MNLEKLEADIMKYGSVRYGETSIRINKLSFCVSGKNKKGKNKKRKNTGSVSSYMVTIPKRIASERTRKQCKKLPDAVKWIEDWLKASETADSTAAEAADFKLNLPRLRAAGVSIGNLLDFYERRYVATDKRKTLKELQDDFERMLETGGRKKRPRYLDSVKTYGKKVLKDFGEDTGADEIQPQAALDWIKGMNATGKTRRHYWNHLNRLLSRAVNDGALKGQPLDGFKPDEVESALDHEKPAPEILTNQDVAKLLQFAVANRPDLLPIIVLGLYAGLRQSESCQITWQQIDLESGFVTVPRSVAKGRNIRHAKLTGAAVQWLRLCEPSEGRLAKGSLNAFSIRFSRFVKRAGFTEWPHNAMRHTHASNYYAIHGAEKTRSQIGHTDKNEAQLFENYRVLVHEADAKKFFQIAPPERTDGNTIAFPGAATA